MIDCGKFRRSLERVQQQNENYRPDPVAVRVQRALSVSDGLEARIGALTRSERFGTLVRVPRDFEVRDPVTTPPYQLIAAEAAVFRDRGETFSVIGSRFGVDPKTVRKALRWLRQP